MNKKVTLNINKNSYAKLYAQKNNEANIYNTEKNDMIMVEYASSSSGLNGAKNNNEINNNHNKQINSKKNNEKASKATLKIKNNGEENNVNIDQETIKKIIPRTNVKKHSEYVISSSSNVHVDERSGPNGDPQNNLENYGVSTSSTYFKKQNDELRHSSNRENSKQLNLKEKFNTNTNALNTPKAMPKAIDSFAKFKFSKIIESDIDLDATTNKANLSHIPSDKQFNIVEICKRSSSQHPKMDQPKELFHAEQDTDEYIEENRNRMTETSRSLTRLVKKRGIAENTEKENSLSIKIDDFREKNDTLDKLTHPKSTLSLCRNQIGFRSPTLRNTKAEVMDRLSESFGCDKKKDQSRSILNKSGRKTLETKDINTDKELKEDEKIPFNNNLVDELILEDNENEISHDSINNNINNKLKKSKIKKYRNGISIEGKPNAIKQSNVNLNNGIVEDYQLYKLSPELGKKDHDRKRNFLKEKDNKDRSNSELRSKVVARESNPIIKNDNLSKNHNNYKGKKSSINGYDSSNNTNQKQDDDMMISSTMLFNFKPCVFKPIKNSIIEKFLTNIRGLQNQQSQKHRANVRNLSQASKITTATTTATPTPTATLNLIYDNNNSQKSLKKINAKDSITSSKLLSIVQSPKDIRYNQSIKQRERSVSNTTIEPWISPREIKQENIPTTNKKDNNSSQFSNLDKLLGDFKKTKEYEMAQQSSTFLSPDNIKVLF